MVQTIPSPRLLVESRMWDALQGDPGACFDLGIALTLGACTRNDRVEAHKWFTLAAQAGYEPAEKSSVEMAGNMSMMELAEARRRARAVPRRHAGQIAQFSARMFS